ncbi:hypothetical protein LCGC14_2676060 [marine sediment metagenome]|uniref:Uncharacterized protein n=1 Tax=marine sediment metagenome TaxID=412755 RepID=A0A0F9BXN4_9ZZZZ
MPITPVPAFKESVADEATPFNVTLAVADTAEDLVSVPSSKFGRIVSLVNEGPGSIALAFDATASAADLLIKEGEAYSEARLEIVTNISFVNVTASQTPNVRGVLWSGD